MTLVLQSSESLFFVVCEPERIWDERVCANIAQDSYIWHLDATEISTFGYATPFSPSISRPHHFIYLAGFYCYYIINSITRYSSRKILKYIILIIFGCLSVLYLPNFIYSVFYSNIRYFTLLDYIYIYM